MTPVPRTTRPVGSTLEAQETLSFEDIACLLRGGSGTAPYSEFSPSYDDTVPSHIDILCGRDKESYRHAGNRRFRAIISKYRDEYQNAKSRDDKTRITDEIVASIRECRERFLRKDKNTNMWYDVGDVYAHEKVSHALRSAKDPERTCKRKKQNVKHQLPTAEENHAFQTLLEQQQHIFRELTNEQQASEVLDFENDDHWLSILV
jgi:hypothetical protein